MPIVTPIVTFDDGPGGVLVANYQEDRFTPTLGQTVFNLAATPVAGTTTMKINGQDYSELGGYFAVAVAVVTWSDTPFSLTTDDEVIITYFIP